VAQVVERLPSQSKALTSNPSTTKEKKKKEKEKREKVILKKILNCAK
jgi:hypothetical protein